MLSMHVRKSVWIITGLATICLIFALLSNEIILFRILYFGLLLLIISFLWTLFTRNAAVVTRNSRNQQRQVGSVFEERFQVKNVGRFWILWVEIIDKSALPGSIASRILIMMKPHSNQIFQVNTRLVHRGEFPLGPTLIRTGDPFGMFYAERIFPAKDNLLTIPLQFDIDHFSSPAGQLSGGKAMRTSSQDATPYASSVREYRIGDSLSRIHWRSTARRQRLMVKEFDQDPQSNIWVLLDANESSQVQSPENSIFESNRTDKIQKIPKTDLPPDTFEYAVTSTATIVKYFIRLGRAVGFASMGSSLSYLTAERGERQLGKVIEALAFIDCKGKLPLLGLVQSQEANFVKGSTVILVSSSSANELEISTDYLLLRGIRMVVVFIDPKSFLDKKTTPRLSELYKSKGVEFYWIKKNDDIKSILGFSGK
jgi:uncharacterized protein (DUF58 family)